MGVHGLWRLIESSGKPVPLETLENKVLAVDISIWLHQCVKGFQDSKGASVPNAHLLGIYHRLCKLLYFRIKPIFVFDGGVPALKRQTIAKRSESRSKTEHEATRLQKQLLNILLKHTAVSKVLTDKIEASIGAKASVKETAENMYVLPSNPSEIDSTLSSSDEESYSETTSDSSPSKNYDLHTIDMKSVHFKSLPADVRHEILSDLKETRKQSSWGRIHELPKVSDDFSIYQMRRLLKRQAVQSALEDAEKEMGGKCLSLGELEMVLKDEGIITNEEVGNRIASDNVTKYILVKDLKAAREAETENNKKQHSKSNSETTESKPKVLNKADAEYEEDLLKAIALSLEQEPKDHEETASSSQKFTRKKLNPAEFSFLENFTDADFASSSSDEEAETSEISKTSMASVQGYMLEYSGLTPMQINKVMNRNMDKKNAKMDKPNFKKLGVIAEDTKAGRKLENKTSSNSQSEKIIDSQIHPDSDISRFQTESVKTQSKCDEGGSDVDFMSSSDSDHDDDYKSLPSKPIKGLEININLTDAYDEREDIFNDIFVEDKTEYDKGLVKDKSEHFLKKEELSSSIEECLITENKIEEFEHENKLVNEKASPSEDALKKEDFANTTLDISKKPEKKNEKESGEVIISTSHVTTIEALEDKEESCVVLSKTPTIKPTLTEEELLALKKELHEEKVELLIQKSSKERIASNITDKIYQEAQELLELFGVPYIIAPMEAEAQCAFLEQIDLTNGTITDDSDVWLFGAKTVYKNFFNENKYVKEFRAENIKHYFKLTRDQMILFALLVGSDYTLGLQGVGPVTAMEILACFPPARGNVNEFQMSNSELLSGLKEFRSWFTKGKTPGPGRNALKNKLKNVTFTENFPSVQVVQAYLDPCVETSRDAFSWDIPNDSELLDYAMIKFGWTKTKSEHILNPVIKRLNEGKQQKTIKDYFKTAYKIHSDATSSLSKRVKSAITNMGRDPTEIMTEELEQEMKKTQKKGTVKRNKGTKAAEFAKKHSKNETLDENINVDKSIASKTSRKRIKEPSEHIEKKKIKYPSIQSGDAGSGTNIKYARPTNNESGDIEEKIKLIRRRRVLKEAKTSIPRESKQKKTKTDKRQIETIPECLREDDEVNILSRVLIESAEKADKITKTFKNKIKMLEAQATAGSSSTRKPPTIKPRKEVLIPQREKDKNRTLRSKLKAIEVFRKGKKGPGYVPKKDKNRRLPKADAELSENSCDE